MREALIEIGIGATRALVIEAGTVVEAHIERIDAGLHAGAVHVARLAKILEPGRRGIMRLGDTEALIEPLPYCPEGGLLRVEVSRAAIHEAGRPRLAKVRNVEGDASVEGEISAGSDRGARLRAAGCRISTIGGHDAQKNAAGAFEDRLEAVGWGEIVDSAQTGHVAFSGGLLMISPTPAMTVIDIDGPGDLQVLAELAVPAVAAAIRRFDLQGSIGIDFPSLEGRSVRTRLGELLDAHLPPPFERTAVNGFGFVQIVRPRLRPSFVEAVRTPGFIALELLRRASFGTPGGRELIASPAAVAWLDARPALLAALARVTGGRVRLQPDRSLGSSGAYVRCI